MLFCNPYIRSNFDDVERVYLLVFLFCRICIKGYLFNVHKRILYRPKNVFEIFSVFTKLIFYWKTLSTLSFKEQFKGFFLIKTFTIYKKK